VLTTSLGGEVSYLIHNSDEGKGKECQKKWEPEHEK
jgi:hypothetical protein